MNDSASHIKSKNHKTREIPTQIKNQDLVKKRRRQIVDASVKLFVENGYHKSTTRQIARATGFSIGSLYEYVSTKEDILYLVCDAIHAEVEAGVTKVLSEVTPGELLISELIREFFLICDRMNDHILLIYQVSQFLPHKWKKKVLENEIRINTIIIDALKKSIPASDLPRIDNKTLELVAHNISVLGQAWAFRRWFYARNYSIKEYIELQTKAIIGIFHK